MSNRMNRRDWLKFGIAGAGGAALYKGLEMWEVLPALGKHKAVDAGRLSEMRQSLGRWIYLTPQKLGGGTHCIDLCTSKTLAWIAYWNYGDTCPISHHVAAYPSDDPYKEFEFVNSTQGGGNILIYGLPTRIKQLGLIVPCYGQGDRIYRVQFDGAQMNLMEDISQSTGIGLGVHTVIYPDAKGFACADGQKDVCAFFNRAKGAEKTKVLMAFRADWSAKNKDSLERCWSEGGTLRLTRLSAARDTGTYDYEGTKGNKINWEMMPMAESLVWRGQLPGPAPRELTGLDAVVHHPNNRWSVLVLRMQAAALVLDRKTWEPVCCLHTPEGSPGNLPVKKVASGPDTWEVQFKDGKCVAREAGFSPDGKFFTMMNNITQNNMSIFDTADPDPRKWKKITFVKNPEWVGEYLARSTSASPWTAASCSSRSSTPSRPTAPRSSSIPKPGRSSRSSRTLARTARPWPSPTTASMCCRSSAASSGCRVVCSSTPRTLLSRSATSPISAATTTA